MSDATTTKPATPSLLPGEHRYEFFKVVQDYLDRAAKVVDIEPWVSAILAQPKNEIIVHFPIRMDDGTVRVFKGYRIQHSKIGRASCRERVCQYV